jgi:hypothetical protein
VSGRLLALDETQSADHRCGGDRNAEITPDACFGTEESARYLGAGNWEPRGEEAGSDDARV